MLREALHNLETAIKELTDINFAVDAASIVAITDQKGIILFVNDNFCKISKYSKEELLGQTHRIVNSGYHSKDIFRTMWTTITSGKIWRGELKNKAKDGTYYWMDTFIVPCLDEQGTPYKYVSIRNDITRRKQIEDTLDLLIATMPDLVIFKDADGRWLKANNAAIVFFQLQGVFYQGKSDEELVELCSDHKEMLLAGSVRDERAWTEGQTLYDEQTLQESMGGMTVISSMSVPVFDDNGRRSGLILLAKDITERRKTEEFLRRADKISAIGKMASGVAHEVRNPLAAIRWTLLQMQEKYAADEMVDLMVAEINRIDATVDQLLSLAKEHSIVMQAVEAKTLISQIIKLMAAQAHNGHIEITLDSEGDLPLLQGDENQLKQVFINIIKNAMEAMPQGGTIAIQTKRMGDSVRIRVIDNGCGIPEGAIAKLGEPFFTTKENGSGLGLMMCHKIIREHGGQIHIASKVGEGTVIDLIFPAGQRVCYAVKDK